MNKHISRFFLFLLMFHTLPVEAGNYTQPGGTRQQTCYTTVYREEYVPGTRNQPGRVRSWTEQQEVDCERSNPHYLPADQPVTRPAPVDDNSCIEGAVLGGIAGGALGAGLSRDEGNFIGIPLGIVGGALVGCQIDGG